MWVVTINSEFSLHGLKLQYNLFNSIIVGNLNSEIIFGVTCSSQRENLRARMNDKKISYDNARAFPNY